MLAVPLLTCGGMGVAHTAWESEFTANYNGSATGSYNNYSGNHNGPVTRWPFLSGEAADSNGALAEVKANGTFSIKCTWVPSQGQTLQTDPHLTD